MKENYNTFSQQPFRSTGKVSGHPEASPGGIQLLAKAKRKRSVFSAGTSLLKEKLALKIQTVAIMLLLFSVGVTAQAQCTAGPVIIGNSNITQSGANVNWLTAAGQTYTLEVYTDAAYTVPFATYASINAGAYTVDGVTPGLVYYYRLKVDNGTVCANYTTGSFTAQNSYSPIDIASGYTSDVIANGVGYASTSTTAPVDVSDYAYLTAGYKATSGSTATTYGVPVNRLLSSPNVTGLKYIMAPYTGNNSLRIAVANAIGTLVFAKPVKLSNVYLAETAGNGPCIVTVDVVFDDGTTQTTTGVSLTNWDSTAPAATPAIAGNLGRVSRTTNSEAGTGNFQIFQVTIPVTAANQSKYVTGVKVTKTSAGTTSPVANIFAVSGQVIGTCPTIGTTLTAAAASYSSANLSWSLVSPGDGATSANVTYTVETFSDAAFTTPVGTPATGVSATSYTVTGLSPTTLYYFRVKAVNSSCNSAYISASATTPLVPCDTPAVPATLSVTTTSSTATGGTITPAATAPTGYLVIRSTSATLSAGPVNNTTYAAAGSIGGGTVVAVGTGATFTNTGLTGGTKYYYFVYAYNSASTCAGPVYSATAATATATTCLAAPLIVGASTVKNTQAKLNWARVSGDGVNAVTYTAEVYSDAGYTTQVGTSVTGITGLSTPLTGLTAGNTYYWRVKADEAGVCSSAYATSSFVAQNSYTPIDVTGFTYDVIANGTGSCASSTSATVDTGSYTYGTNDYKPNATAATGTGFPLNRVISSATAGHVFFMQDYAANNSLRLPTVNTTSALTFATSLPLTNVYLAVVAGETNATFTAEVLFDDSTSQVFTGLTAINWDSAAATGLPAVISGMGRVDRNSTTSTLSGTTFKVFPLTLNIDAANQGKYITGIKFTKTTPANAILNIFAVSGKVTPDCNNPSNLAATGLTSSAVTLGWSAAAPAPANGYEYYYSATNTAPLAAAAVNNANVVTTNTVSLSGLTSGTAYYWWVRSLCSASSTSSWTSGGSFTPTCLTPDAATAFTATGTSASTATLAWTAPAIAPTGYVVFRSASATAPTVTAGTTYAVGTTYNTNYLCVYNGSAATASLTGLSGATQYYFYIVSVNATGCPAAYSTVGSATTTTCINTPLIVGASNIKNSQANLTWTKVPAVAGGTVTYSFELYTDAGYTTLVPGSALTGLTALRTTVTGLTANATYYWRVKADQSGYCSSPWVTSSFIAQNSYTPIDVNGFTTDVIANGVGIANLSTTGAVDAVSNAYISLDYKQTAASAASTIGLPLNRNLTGSITDLKFFLEDYSGSNSIRMGAQNESATINLTVPLKMTDMFIAVTGGSGAPTVTADISFEDGTVQSATGIVFTDWYGTSSTAQPSLISGIGRANRADTTGGIETGDSKIFQITIPINAANQDKKITSVKFTKTSTGDTEPVANIFAISGKVIGDCPTMNTSGAVVNSYSNATVNWTLSTPGEGYTAAQVSYRIEVYTNANFTGAVTGSPFTTAGGAASYTLTNLLANTTYYYKVTGINSSCESGALTGSFTTPPSCIVPTGLTSSAVTAYAASIGWTAASPVPENGYEYYYSTSATAPTASTVGTMVPTGNTASLTGLAPNTTYYFWVRSVCVGADRSAWLGSGTFTTTQIPATLNLAEGFEGANNWTLVNGSQTNKWFAGTATANGGTTSLYISDAAAGTTLNYNISAASVSQAYRDIAIPAGTTNVEFSFDWKAYGESNYDYLRVWLVPATYNPVAGTQTAAATGRIQVGGDFNLQSAYNTYSTPTLNVSSFAGQTMRLVFEWRNDGSLGTEPPASVDNIVMNIPICATPSNLTSVSTLTSAALSWAAPATAPANGYEYYYSTTNTAPTAAGTATTATSVNLTGLTTGTTYYFWVRDICSATTSSAWISGGSFYTGFCTPVYSACDTTHYITSVAVTGAGTSFSDTISSSTACSTGRDRTATQITVSPGQTYTFSVNSLGWASIGIAADLNGNANFSDANEILSLPLYVASNPYTYTPTVTIPADVATGQYRLRIWNREANAGAGTSPCGSYNNGSYVDYTLNVVCYTWTGATSSDWSTASNWCGGAVPTATSNVTIATTSNNPVISTGTALANNLTVNAGATLTVATGATLNVAGAITTTGTLTVQNNAAILQGGTTNTNTGNIVFHKNSNALYRLDYTLWASPVSGQTLSSFAPLTSTDRFYTYVSTPANANATTGHYQVVAAPGTTAFADATGYLIRTPNTGSAAYAAGTEALTVDGTFTGTPHNGNVTVALNTTGDQFTAIGNPYPSPIGVAELFAAGSGVLDASTPIYFWRKRNNSAHLSYYSVNTASYVVNSEDGGSAVTGFNGAPSTWTIAPGQGFLVKAGSGSSFTFTNSMRKAATASQAFFRDASSMSRLWINIRDNNDNFSQASIAYLEGATLGIDYGMDGAAFSTTGTSLYSTAQNKALAIQARPAFQPQDVVPVGFTVPAAGQYSIALDHFDGVFADGQTIYLKDNLLGITHNLNDSAYSFTANAGNLETRFEVVYVTDGSLGTPTQTLDANAVMVYKHDKAININAGTATINTVTVFDIRGRVLYSQGGVNATSTVINSLSVEQEVLIIEIATDKGKVSKRIVY